MWWTRLKALIVKELSQYCGIPKARIILIAPPIAQLMIFSFAATLEVKNADIAFLNRDAGRWGLEIVHRIDAAPTFGRVLMVDGPEALRSAIDTQKAIAAVHIGQTFSRDIEAGAPADLQIILDGRKSNASQIVAGYLTQIVNGVAAETQPADARPPPRSATSPATGLIQT